jgi:hypothetical protein
MNVNCPHCQAEISHDAELSDKDAACPVCGKVFRMPFVRVPVARLATQQQQNDAPTKNSAPQNSFREPNPFDPPQWAEVIEHVPTPPQQKERSFVIQNRYVKPSFLSCLLWVLLGTFAGSVTGTIGYIGTAVILYPNSTAFYPGPACAILAFIPGLLVLTLIVREGLYSRPFSQS